MPENRLKKIKETTKHVNARSIQDNKDFIHSEAKEIEQIEEKLVPCALGNSTKDVFFRFKCSHEKKSTCIRDVLKVSDNDYSKTK